jgi:DNA mismatch repair protein MutS
VKQWQGEVVFLHEVVAGAADGSYGVQVAKLAGLPAAVIDRAKVVLAELEAEDRTSPARRLVDDLPLFSAAARATPPPPRQDEAVNAIIDALAALNPDDLSPREVLEALSRLKLAAAKRQG